jgi:hypothetical protein
VRYRKQGSVIRWEDGLLVSVRECGAASENGERFECRPEPGDPPAVPDASGVTRTAAAVAAMVPHGVTVERLIVTEGAGRHECEGRSWEERSQRLHVSLVRGPVRIMLDLQSADGAVALTGQSMLRMTDAIPPAPRVARLAPHVTAALMPSFLLRTPRGAEVWQTGGGIDGLGREIEEAVIGEPPNWYRPSYRVRPVRMPLNVRLEADDAPFVPAPLVTGLAHDGRLLIDDGERSWIASGSVQEVLAVERARTWFPYGAGAWASETLVSLVPSDTLRA